MTNWQRAGMAFVIGWCLAGLIGIAYLAYRLAR